MVSATVPHGRFNLCFLDWSRYFLFKQLLNWPHEAEWTPFQTHYYSENLVAPGIEHETSVSVARNSTFQNRMGRRWGRNECYGAWWYFCEMFHGRKVPPTPQKRNRRTKRIIRQCETGRKKKPKEGQQDWSHLAQELTSKTCCARKDRREEKTTKKTWATTGWPYGRELILEYETGSTRLYSLELALEGGCGPVARQSNECLK